MTYIYHPTNYPNNTTTTSIPLPLIIVIVVLAVLTTSLSAWHVWYRREYEQEYRAAINREPDLTRKEFKARCKETKWRPWKSPARDSTRPTSQMEHLDVERGVDERNSTVKPLPVLSLAYSNTRPASPHPSSPSFPGEPCPLPGAPHASPRLSSERATSPLLGTEVSPMLGSVRSGRSTESGRRSRVSLELAGRHNSRIVTVEDIHAAQGFTLAPAAEPAPVSRREECGLVDPPPAYTPESSGVLHVSG